MSLLQLLLSLYRHASIDYGRTNDPSHFPFLYTLHLIWCLSDHPGILDWKDDSKISYDERWGKYVESYKDSLTKIDEVSASLKELDAMVYSTEHCSEGELYPHPHSQFNISSLVTVHWLY